MIQRQGGGEEEDGPAPTLTCSFFQGQPILDQVMAGGLELSAVSYNNVMGATGETANPELQEALVLVQWALDQVLGTKIFNVETP